MQSAKPNQALAGWYSSLYRLQALMPGVLFHMGLICANFPIFGLGIRFLYHLASSRTSRQIQITWLGVGIQLYYFAPVYYQVLSPMSWYTFGIFLGVCLVFIGLWWLWWRGYQSLIFLDSTGLMPVLWLFILQLLWSGLGIGFYQLSPLLVNTPFEGLIYGLGDYGIWLVLLCLHQKNQFRCYVGLLILLIVGSMMAGSMSIEHEVQPDWLSEITIYAEGQGHDISQGDAIVARRIHQGDAVYHASVGVGDVTGVSVKRHLVPWVEEGYTPRKLARVFDYQGHKILVLICNDVLFRDFADEIAESDRVVVLSHLSDLAHTPILIYFQQYLRYLSIYYGIPIHHIDQDFNQVFGVGAIKK